MEDKNRAQATEKNWTEDRSFVQGRAFDLSQADSDDPNLHLSKMDRRSRVTVGVIGGILLLLILGVFLWAESYYRADAEAVAAVEAGRQVSIWQKNLIALGDEEADTAFVFYPGGMVEESAYLPLLQQVSEQGVLCLVASMPFHLAVLDKEACEELMRYYPEVETWYIGGHSLGGAMAAEYAAEHEDLFAGVVLLAAYPTLPTDLPVLSVYGDRDQVLDRTKYADAPWGSGVAELVLAGGNHAQFGNYGVQKGDGEAAITREEQQTAAAEAILEFIGD